MTKEEKPEQELEKELAELQNALSEVDFYSQPEGSNHAVVKFLVKTYQSIRLRMDGDKNHARPHLHVDYGHDYHVASYAIDNGQRLAGDLHRRYDKQVRGWIANNQVKLLKTWEQTQLGAKPENIICELRETPWWKKKES
jgi:hypothetical protein